MLLAEVSDSQNQLVFIFAIRPFEPAMISKFRPAAVFQNSAVNYVVQTINGSG